MAMQLKELAEKTGTQLSGAGDCRIECAADISQAQAGDIAFIYSAKYAHHLQTTHASALVITRELAAQCTLPALISDNPRLSFARVVALLHPLPAVVAGIAPSATVAADASVAASACVEAGVVIAGGAYIAEGAHIGANSVIGENSVVGRNTRLHANVSIAHDCVVGDDCIVHSGVVIGADGFGFVADAGHFIKVPQIGGVRIGNAVEIGACTSIDRGALHDTVIENGVKLDNQIQIGHNVHIGHDTVISACSCVAGSTRIGAHCLIGGAVGIRYNIEIADNTVITGRTFINNSITKAGSYSSSTPMDTTENWRRNSARFRQLDSWVKRILALEKTLHKDPASNNNNK